MDYQFHFGKKFYKDKKAGYWISTQVPKIRAHVWVWEYYNGKCPKGFHVHHKDEDKSNNDVSNLQIMEASKHLALHWTPEKRKKAVLHAEKIRPLSKQWHKSEEGREWHRQHGIKCWNEREAKEKICCECKHKFATKTFHQEFCSNKCKSAWRRKSKVDDIEIICLVCGIAFKRNKYGKTRMCGRKCGGIFKSKEYRGAGKG